MKTDTRSFYEEAVRKAVAHIEDHLDEALDLTALARHAALSPFHFHRVFRGMVGETPLEMHRRLRMERAAHRLLSTESGVTEIAFEAGYDTHEAFTRAFRAAWGEPPSAFRRSSAETTRPSWLASRAQVHFRANGARNELVTIQRGEEIMDVTIKDMQAMRLAAVHHKGAYPKIGEAFGKLGMIAQSTGLMDKCNVMVAVYHDDPEATPVEELRSDAALSIPEGVTIPTELTELRIAGGRYACAMHKGPYSGLPDAWSRLMGSWLPKSGERVGKGESFEIYRNTPMNAKPEDLVTELYVPLA